MIDFKEIYYASSVKEALEYLDINTEAILISGGTDVIIQIRNGKINLPVLVSIHEVDELKGIAMNNEGTIFIKSGTTFSEISNHPLIKKYVPVLGEAVDLVGGPQIRSMATIGGNICNGVTSADSCPILMALNAELILDSIGGKRVIPITEFHKSPGVVKIKKGEILTEIQIHKNSYENYSGCYIKYSTRKAMDIATLGCAVMVRLDPSKEFMEDVRIAFGVAGPIPKRCFKTENLIRKMKITDEMFEVISERILLDVSPRSSWRSSQEFRLYLIQACLKKALSESILKSGGAISWKE